MTPDPEVLPITASVAFVLNKMSIGGFRHVPVVDEEHRPRFVVAVRDVVAYLVDAFPREVLNLPPEGGKAPSYMGLQFQLPDRSEILTGSGVAVTRNGRTVGVRFTNLPPDAAWAIESFLSFE